MAEAVEVVHGELVDYGSLSENEQIIERGMTSFIDVGRALARIRDDRQYVMAGFDAFEDYCNARWDLGKRLAYYKIGAAEVCTMVHSRGLPLPPTERATRPLTELSNERGEDAVVEAWSQIVDAHEGDGPITSREVTRFLKVGGGASYHKPAWHELLGEVGDTLIRADKQLTKVEDSITRKPSEEFREKAGRYALWARDLSDRLREIEAA